MRRDDPHQRTPLVVRLSFILFALVLATPGARMATGDTRVLPWDAPREVTIHRKEIFEQIMEENRSAIASTDSTLPNLNEFLAIGNGAIS